MTASALYLAAVIIEAAAIIALGAAVMTQGRALRNMVEAQDITHRRLNVHLKETAEGSSAGTLSDEDLAELGDILRQPSAAFVIRIRPGSAPTIEPAEPESD